MFNYLSVNGEKVLKYAIEHETEPDRGTDIIIKDMRFSQLHDIAKELHSRGFAHNLSTTTSVILILKQPGRDYFLEKKRYQKENQKFGRREWVIAISSASIGAIIGLIPWIVSLVSGGCN